MKRQVYLLATLLYGSILLSSCSSNVADVPVEEAKDKYLVSYTLMRVSTVAEVTTVYTLAQTVYPEMADLFPSIKSGLKVYSVTYNTTFGSRKLIASGLVCIPDGSGTYPILSFQNGTNTVYANAPSVSSNGLTSQLITGFATAGFVMVLPDYIGFGASKEVFHPYLHKESTVTPILDLFRAVKEMSSKTELNLRLSPDLYIMGYSQGGLSTLQLQNAIETSYSSEFSLKAVGCGAGPYNLPALTEIVVTSSTFPQPYYIAYLMKGFKSAGAITNPYSDIFNEPYASRIDGLFNGINGGSAINDQLSTNMSQLFTNEFRTTFSTGNKFISLKDVLTSSSVPAWRIKTPLILTHGQADTDVSPTMSRQLYEDLMKLDPALPVTYIPMPGLDHGSASAPSLISFIKKFLVIKGN
jgi:pimeloyl-ACP methyl ester carboxylesterase